MKRKLIITLILTSLTLLTLPSCSNDDPKDEPIDIQLTRSQVEAVNAINDFTFDLLKASEKNLSGEKPNYIMSPQSLAWCIAMVANGAEPNSETLKEMIDVLHLDGEATLQDVNDYSSKLIEAITSKNGSVDIRVANALHYKSEIGIKHNFVNTLKSFYKIGEFADPANKDMDAWISDRTGGLITNFASDINIERYDFGVINTLYFNGKWGKRFDPANTKESEFHNADGTISRPLMMSEEQTSIVSSDETCHVLKLFFKNESFAINFVIPTEGKKINEALSHLNGNTWKQLMSNKNSSIYYVKIPKLNLKSNFDFIGTIRDMGLKKIFARNNELSQIASNPVMITNLAQASIIELDEDGVKAATTSHKGGGDIAFLPRQFILDEPFYFFITEESTGAILFAGKIAQL